MFWASYIGLELNENDIELIYKEAKSILSDCDDKIAWHNLIYYHVTLVFLGWLSNSDAKKVLTIIEHYRNLFESRSIDFTGYLKVMGWDDNYITLEVQNSSWLSQSVNDIKKELEKEEINYKKQEFIPHLSLGRYNGNLLSKEQTIISPISGKVNGIYLYESISSSNKLFLQNEFNK